MDQRFHRGKGEVMEDEIAELGDRMKIENEEERERSQR